MTAQPTQWIITLHIRNVQVPTLAPPWYEQRYRVRARSNDNAVRAATRLARIEHGRHNVDRDPVRVHNTGCTGRIRTPTKATS